MARYKLTIAYDGRPYCGWQKQAEHPSVQAVLEDAVKKLDGAHALVYGAGRTDTGVHAVGQVAHVDLSKSLSADTVQGALNFHMRPHPVSILDVSIENTDFHARFGAVERAYEYRILNRRGPPAFRKGLVWHITAALDIEAMQKGANYLLGFNDFTTFRDTHCQAKSPSKTLDTITITRERDEVILRVSARSFLHRQIRSFIGSLVEVGRRKYPPEWIDEILKAKNRKLCGPVAPPDGLYLIRVAYEHG